jgi:hypothetical protein
VLKATLPPPCRDPPQHCHSLAAIFLADVKQSLIVVSPLKVVVLDSTSAAASPTSTDIPGGYSMGGAAITSSSPTTTTTSPHVPAGYSTGVASPTAAAADTYGQLPLKPSSRQLPLEQRSFFKRLTRQQAEAVLARATDGTFVLRPSSQTDARCTLSHRSFDGTIGHALLFYDARGWSLEGADGLHATIDDLLLSLPLLHDQLEHS